MTDEEIREKAIEDVAIYVDVSHKDRIAWVKNRIDSPADVEERSVAYAVSQREMAIRRGELIKGLLDTELNFDKVEDLEWLVKWCLRATEELKK